MARLHGVRDTDLHFKIDAITRTITNQTTNKTRLMQFDHNSERFTFEIQRLVDGHDMYECNEVRVHFINVGSTSSSQNKGIYPVTDIALSSENDSVVFSWLVSQNATKLAGTLNFLIQFACTQEDGTVDYAWHTDIFKGISISTGLSNEEIIVDQYIDVLTQWRSELFGVGNTVEQQILDLSKEQQRVIETKSQEEQAALENRNQELLAESVEQLEIISRDKQEILETKIEEVLITSKEELIAVSIEQQSEIENKGQESLALLLSQLNEFVVIGDVEPEHGPVIWFDTNVQQPSTNTEVLLVLGDETDVTDVVAQIEDEKYPVLNADSPQSTDGGETYAIEVSQ